MRYWVLALAFALCLSLTCLWLPSGAITISGGGGGFPTVECADIGGNHLNFTGGVWTCGTSSSGGAPGNAKADGATKGIATFTAEFTDNGSGLIGLAPALVNHTLGNTNTFVARDDRFTLQADTDPTRQARFRLIGITPGQTRLLTLPNIDGTLATLAGTETFTGKTLSGTSNTITNLPEAALALTDVTTANATTVAHGFLPKLPGGTTAFLRADGTFAVPPGSVSSVTSVFGRAGVVVAQAGDYTAVQVTNAADLTAANAFTHPTGQSMARLILPGTTSGTLSLRPPSLAGTSVVTFPAGSIDFTTTGGPGQVVRQSTVGAPLTVSQLGVTDLAGGASVCTTSVVCIGYQALIPYVPENSANRATSTALGTSDIAYPSQNAVKVYVDGSLSTKQNLLGFSPEDVANKSNATALGTNPTLYPSQNAVKVYVDTQIATRQPTVTWGDGLAFAGGTASTASTETNFLTNGVATPLACGLGATGRAQVLANGEFQYCDGAGTAILRSGLPTQSGLTWNITPSACTADANGGKLTLNPAGTQIVCASDIGGTGGGGGVTSIFGRTGAVIAQPGDYTAAQVTNAADLTAANTFTHASGQTVARLMLALAGGGTVSLRPPAAVGSSIVTFPSGSIDFSATGGASQVVRQSTLGGPFTVSQLAFSDLAGQITQAQHPNLNTLNTGLTPLRCVETDATGKLTVTTGLCGTGTGGLPDTGAMGFVVRNSATPTTVARTLQGTALQITVTNPTGVGGDPIISIAPNPTLPGLTTGNFSGPLAGNASTATALAVDPPPCPANQFVTDQAANGTLTCLQPSSATLSDGASLVKLTAAQKVTNKQNVPREVLYTPAGAPLAITPGCDTADMVVVNAIAGPLTINDPGPCTGSNPEASQELTMRLFSTASRALTFGTGYSAEAGVPFPAATTGDGNTYDYLKFIRNSVTSKWDLVAIKSLDKTVSTRAMVVASPSPLVCNINTDRQCQQTNTAAVNNGILIETPLGSPNDGDLLMILLLCQNSQPITFNLTTFIASPNVPFPTTCPADLTKHTVIGVRYSAILSKYQLLASN